MTAPAVVSLCEGCGEPLIGKRRGTKAHNSTCRWRKKRRLERELREPQFCPSCGGTCMRLEERTGWCPSCTRELERMAA